LQQINLTNFLDTKKKAKMSEAKKENTKKKAVKKPRIKKVETAEIPVKEQIKATETSVVEAGIKTTVTNEVNNEIIVNETEEVVVETPVVEEEVSEKEAVGKIVETPVVESVIETAIIEEVKEEKVPKQIVEEVVPFDWETISNNDNYTKAERVDLEKEYSTTLPEVIGKQVIDGVVVMVTDREVVVNINFKSDGVISFNEFKYNPELKAGDIVEVLVEKQEDKNGQLVLSHRRARVLRAWEKVNVALETG